MGAKNIMLDTTIDRNTISSTRRRGWSVTWRPRTSTMRSLSQLNSAPVRPLMQPISANGSSSQMAYESAALDASTSNSIDCEKSYTPHPPLTPLSRKLVMNVAVMQAKKVRHVSICDQKLLASSMANSTPPSGAPKAEATPHAAPIAMKSRRSRSVWKRWNHGICTFSVLLRG